MHPAVVDGKYQIVRALGEGGMGTVYEARHAGTGRRVAVKVIVNEALAKSPDIVARFQREARAAGAIESQHIAHVLDTGFDRDTGNPYMVMEYLSGEDVSQTIERIGPLPPDLALRIIAQACIGLQKAHEVGIVHRDIKPANLYLVHQDGGDVLVKVLDFGIAKVGVDQMNSAANAALTRTGSMLGSPLYMSPEQAKGSKNIDHRSDVWSLGVVFYECLTGLTPHAACDTLGGLILAICSETPRVVQDHAPWVAPEIAAIVHKALTLDANLRYPSAADMLAAIRALLRGANAITSDMIAPLSPQARSVVAPRYVETSQLAMSVPGAPPAPGTTTPTTSTTPTTTAIGAAAITHPAAHRRGRGAIVGGAIAGTLAVVGGATFAAYRVLGPKPPAVASASASGASAIATSPIATPSTEAPTARTAQLAIVPPTASVQVDGNSVAIANGAVPIVGVLGSVHRVRVAVGKKETLGDVVIAEDGVVPSKIELGVAPPAPTSTGAAPTMPASTGAATTATSRPTTTSPAPTSPPAPKPPTPAGLDRKFD